MLCGFVGIGNLVQREYEPLDRSERQYLGWIPLPGGIIGPAPGSGGFSGAAWARRLRILIATISVLANFRFTPFEPWWALTIILIDLRVVHSADWPTAVNEGGRANVCVGPDLGANQGISKRSRMTGRVFDEMKGILIMPRKPVPPLEPGWVIVNGSPMFHRFSLDAGDAADAMVHVHGFGISGTYLEPGGPLPRASVRSYLTYPGWVAALGPRGDSTYPGLQKALMAYCDTVGVERPILVGNSLGCPIIVEVATTFPIESSVPCWSRRLVAQTTNHSVRLLDKWPWTGFVSRHRCCRSQLVTIFGSGALRSLSLFRAMTRYPTLERLPHLVAPTLVIAGLRDPLVRIANAPVWP